MNKEDKKENLRSNEKIQSRSYQMKNYFFNQQDFFNFKNYQLSEKVSKKRKLDVEVSKNLADASLWKVASERDDFNKKTF